MHCVGISIVFRSISDDFGSENSRFEYLQQGPQGLGVMKLLSHANTYYFPYQ